MKTHVRDGIEITREDGDSLASGQLHYWDADYARVLQADLGVFFPDAEYHPGEDGKDSFRTVFRKNSNHGRELCWDSRSLDDGVRIPELEVDSLVRALDVLHQRAEDPRTTPDTAHFIRNMRVPDPREMKSAWRMAGGPIRRLLILWGYASAGSLSTCLPLTPTSATWDDAAQRVDLKKVLLSRGHLVHTRTRINWAWIGKWLLRGLLALLLLAVIYTLVRIEGCDGSGGGLVGGPSDEPRNDLDGGSGGSPADGPSDGSSDGLGEGPRSDFDRGEEDMQLHRFSVIQKSEKKNENLYYPEFELCSQSGVLPSKSTIHWTVNGVPGKGGGKLFAPQEGWSPELHQVVASIKYNDANNVPNVDSASYDWQKADIDPDAVERHIGLAGNRQDNAKRQYFLLHLYLQPDDGRTSVSSWTATMDDGKTPIPLSAAFAEKGTAESASDDANSCRLYMSDMPHEGAVRVVAEADHPEFGRKEVVGIFSYAAGVLVSGPTVNPAYEKVAHAWATTINPSVCCWVTCKSNVAVD